MDWHFIACIAGCWTDTSLLSDGHGFDTLHTAFSFIDSWIHWHVLSSSLHCLSFITFSGCMQNIVKHLCCRPSSPRALSVQHTKASQPSQPSLTFALAQHQCLSLVGERALQTHIHCTHPHHIKHSSQGERLLQIHIHCIHPHHMKLSSLQGQHG
jgi:hypothetical protein